MKKILAVLILIFTLPTPSQAEDIRDFEIEGISIGDSLLDYFSKKEISEMKNYIFPDKKFEGVKLDKHRKFDNYDRVQAVFKHKDKDFIIHSISGGKDYINKTKKCEKTKEIISNQILNLFDVKPDIREHKNRKIKTDPSGKSTFNETEFRITDLERINIRCSYMSQTMIERHHFDELELSVSSREFIKYWNTENKKENVDEREIDLIRLGPYALGDNLLDFFSEGEINYAVSRSSSYKDSKKIKAGLFKSKTKPYDSFEIVYQQVNNKKVIVMMSAKAKFIDMETCLNTRKDLQDEFFGKKELINIKKNEEEGYNAIFAQLRDGGGIGFSCAKRGQKKYDLILRIFSVDFPSLAK